MSKKKSVREPKPSKKGFWVDNYWHPERFIIVDCGYCGHPDSKKNAQALVYELDDKNDELMRAYGGLPHWLVRIPRSKLHVLEKFPEITEGKGLCCTTHVYDRNGPQHAWSVVSNLKQILDMAKLPKQ